MTAIVRTARGAKLLATERRRTGWCDVDLRVAGAASDGVSLSVRMNKSGAWRIEPPSMLGAAARILGVDEDDVYAAIATAVEPTPFGGRP